MASTIDDLGQSMPTATLGNGGHEYMPTLHGFEVERDDSTTADGE